SLDHAFAGFEPVSAYRIEEGDEADDAGIALAPQPGIGVEGRAPAGDLVEIAADILDGRDLRFQQRLMRGVPFREILQRLAADRVLVLLGQISDLRPVAMRAQRGRERV